MGLSPIIRERLERLQKGEPIEQILPPTPRGPEQELLRRCALVREFGEDLLNEVLRRFPTEISESAVPTTKLYASCLVEQVPWDASGRLQRIAPEERGRLLGDGRDLHRLSEELVRHFNRRQEPLEALYHLAAANPGDAAGQWKQLCEQADADHTLPAYEDLLQLIEGRNVNPELVAECARQRARLNSLALWSNEYYRTGRYLDRATLSEALDRLLVGGEKDPWVLQIHAHGGSGKTMFVRWASARKCVGELKIPSARIDFDDSRQLKFAQNPMELAAELDRQWGKQLPGNPKLFVQMPTPVPFPLREVGANLNNALGGKRVLLVLDTLEELLIGHRPELVATLRQVEAMRKECPQLIVILSGRYDLKDRLGGEYGVTGEGAIDLPVPKFDPEEARDYLVKLRGLDKDDDRISAIILRATGNPLKLSLYVEIIEHEPGLTRQDILDDKQVELAFLIRRVVNHIHDERLQWVLRYGVISNRLTQEIVTEVIAEPVERESRSQVHDDTKKGMTDSLVKTNPFRRVPEGETIDFNVLWRELKQYAGSSSWVREEGDALIFTNDVLAPMRALLLAQEETVFVPLHDRAWKYFLDKAKSPEANRLDCLRQAVFHDFQRRGHQAGEAWRLLVESDLHNLPAWRMQLATEACSRSCVTDDDPPRIVERPGGRPMISPNDLVSAYYHLARAHVDLARVMPDPQPEWKGAADALARLNAFARSQNWDASRIPRIALVQGELASHDTTVLLDDPSNVEKAKGRQKADEALRWFDIAVEQGHDVIGQQALQRRAELLERIGSQRAIEDYDLLESRFGASAEPGHRANLRERQAKLQLRFDQCQEALHNSEQAWSELSAAKFDAQAEQLDLLCRRIHLRMGRPVKAIDSQTYPAENAAPSTEWIVVRDFLRVEASLALREPIRALAQFREAREERKRTLRQGFAQEALLPTNAAQYELRARLAIELVDYHKVTEQLQKATAEWVKLRKDEESHRVLAATMAFYLHQLGDLLGAQSCLDSAPRDSDPVHSEAALQVELLRAELVQRLGRPDEAEQILKTLLPRLGSDVPPRSVVLAALTGLTLSHPDSETVYFRRLVDALSAVTPATTRAELLAPLERCAEFNRLDDDDRKRFVDLLPDVDHLDLTARERALIRLRCVEALRVIGHGEQARDELDRARALLITKDVTTFPLPALLRAEDRLGRQRDACDRGRELLPRFATEFLSDSARFLTASAWLDQFERAVEIQSLAASSEAQAEVHRRLERVDSALANQWLARFHLARAQRNVLVEENDAAIRHKQSAKEHFRQLGDVATSNLLDSILKLHKTKIELVPSQFTERAIATDETSERRSTGELSLFGEPAALTIELRWDRDDEFIVSFEMEGYSHRDVVPPRFLQEIGWTRQATSEGAAPFQAVRALDRDGTNFALGLQSLLPRQTFPAQLVSQVSHVRLVTNVPSLSAIPWELLRLIRPNVPSLPTDKVFYRSVGLPGVRPVPIKWLQSALRELLDSGLPVDGVDSERLRSVIRTFQRRVGLLETGIADARTRWEVDRRCRTVRRDPRRFALLVVESTADEPNVVRENLGQLYRRLGFEVLVAHNETEALEIAQTEFQGKMLSIVHIAASLAEAHSLGVYYHFDSSTRSSPSSAFSSKFLHEILNVVKENDLKPFVLLSTSEQSSQFEMSRQMFLRNAFARELFDRGNAPVVVATGVQRYELFAPLIDSLGKGRPIGIVTDEFRGPASQASDSTEFHQVQGTALFAVDPDSYLPGAGTPIAMEQSTERNANLSRTVHALMVGINDYPNPIPPLRGCVNDVDALASYLSERVAGEGDVALKLLVLKNQEATRQRVIDAFRQHLGQAKPGDVALFYFSGHGSQEQAPEEFWRLEPDHLDETLVCYDSRNPDCWDLADKELAKLIGEVSAQGAHVAVILDCCHSGSGTREMGTVVRRAPTDLRKRPIGSFIVSADEVTADSSRNVGDNAARWYAPPTGRHILLAACRDDEEAKECIGDGQHRGAFSFYLGDALKGAAGVPTYRDLLARTSALVAGHISSQNPQLEAAHADDLDGVFLDGVIRPSAAAFTVSQRNGGWIINGGMVNGVPRSQGTDAVQLALFRFDASSDDLRDPSKVLGTARVDVVSAASSTIVIDGALQLDASQTYKAVVQSLPTPALGVRLEGDGSACELVRSAIARSPFDGQPSVFIREEPSDQAEFRLIARDGKFVITRPTEDRPLVAPVDGCNESGARRVVQQLEHMARWTQTARLSNPTSSIQPADVKLTVLVDSKEVSGKEIRLEYERKDGKEVIPTFHVSLTNNSKRPLFCALLDLTQRFRVSTALMPAGCVKLQPNATAWAFDGKPIPATIPKDVWESGVIEYKDVLKLIVCTESFDPRTLEQPTLDSSVTRGGLSKAIGRNGSLNRLMKKVQTRELGDDSPEIDDWQTSEVTFTVVRPLVTTSVPESGKSATLPGGVKLLGHSSLKANARLGTAPLAARDLGRITLPRQFIDDPATFQPLSFTQTRGSNPGLSVLELTDVVDVTVVTPDAPLRLELPGVLAANEHVLPIAFDGEFFLPLGRIESRTSNSTIVALERLPPPLADSRSLTGAIKIFFQKVVSKFVGEKFQYPLLAAVDVSPDARPTTVRDADQIRKRVDKAQRILLFIHGIIGETQAMAPSIQLAKLENGSPLSTLYDVVLTFDYENLNTTIEENARLLKDRLESLGLKAGHTKDLVIAAHSMGGLVARWFIEREAGNQMVRTLVMLGTPNGGSPWPRMVDWATIALGLGLNHLTATPWPSSVISYLTSMAESPTIALNQMRSHSPFLKELKQSPDPKIPYFLLAGNTSIIPAANSTEGDKPSLIQRLIQRVTSPQLWHSVASQFFAGEDNDIAVSLDSMQDLDPRRQPKCDVRVVACDHLSYFQDPAGLKAFSAALAAVATAKDLLRP